MSSQSSPSIGDSGEWILNTIKRNPEGLLLLAAGAVLMLRTESRRSPRSASQDTLSDTTWRATDGPCGGSARTPHRPSPASQ